MKATIIGAGNIGLALADGLIRSRNCTAAEITVTRRSASALEALQQKGFATATRNADAVKNASVIFLCVLPQQLNGVLDEIKQVIDAKDQLVVSVVTGVHTNDIRARLSDDI